MFIRMVVEGDIMVRLLMALGVIGTIFVLSPVRPPLATPSPGDLREGAVATAIEGAADVAAMLRHQPGLPPVRLRP